MEQNGFALIGMIVSWPNSYAEEIGPDRAAGRGRVCAATSSIGAPYLLVEVLPRAGDDEPPHQIVVRCDEVNLKIFPTLEAEEKWFEWIMSDGKERVVKLVRPLEPIT